MKNAARILKAALGAWSRDTREVERAAWERAWRQMDRARAAGDTEKVAELDRLLGELYKVRLAGWRRN